MLLSERISGKMPINDVKKKFNSIDLFKFIMSLCVVAIHINPLANCRNQTILALYSTITKLAVPFFFLSSGFLMTYNLNYPYKDQKSIE